MVETAQAIQKQGLAKITRVETGYPAISGKPVARLAVTLTADWPYPDPNSYSNLTLSNVLLFGGLGGLRRSRGRPT